MELIVIILLGFIAYFLWKIYKNLEQTKLEAKHKETEIKYKEAQEKEEKEFKEKYKEKYPHLVGNIENNWLEVFGEEYLKMKVSHPHLRAAQSMYLKADNNTKQNNEVDFILCDLWDLTEELLEHLEKYHVGTTYEFEIAIVYYWQLVATEADSFTGENDVEVIRKRFQAPPYSTLSDLASWFPKKHNHPKGEIALVDKITGVFPRKSKGSDIIEQKLKDL